VVQQKLAEVETAEKENALLQGYHKLGPVVESRAVVDQANQERQVVVHQAEIKVYVTVINLEMSSAGV
jgi:hypothetical protein